jgi:hypothetical protein
MSWEWIIIVIAFVWLFLELGKTNRDLAVVVSRLRDCERRLDWWVTNGVVDLDDGKGPHRHGLTGNTPEHVQKTRFNA